MRKVPNGQYFYMSVDGYTQPSLGRFNTSYKPDTTCVVLAVDCVGLGVMLHVRCIRHNMDGSRVWHHMSVRASAARLATDEECLAFAIAALEVPSVQGG